MNKTEKQPSLSRHTVIEVSTLRENIEGSTALLNWLLKNDELLQEIFADTHGFIRAKVFSRTITLHGIQTAHRAVRAWPDAEWVRVDNGITINYETEVDGVTVELHSAEDYPGKPAEVRTPLTLSTEPATT